MFTNRNTLIFDIRGQQIPYLQDRIDCYGAREDAVILVAKTATKFQIAKWRDWAHEISAEEWVYLLGYGFYLNAPGGLWRPHV